MFCNLGTYFGDNVQGKKVYFDEVHRRTGQRGFKLLGCDEAREDAALIEIGFLRSHKTPYHCSGSSCSLLLLPFSIRILFCITSHWEFVFYYFLKRNVWPRPTARTDSSCQGYGRG